MCETWFAKRREKAGSCWRPRFSLPVRSSSATRTSLSQIPFVEFVARAERGVYATRPARVFEFGEIVSADRLMESGEARGKTVVLAPPS